MKGDFTRLTFKKKRHYSGVRWQQGRVHVDADWNEEMDILAHRDRTTRFDVIGPCGGPAGTDGDGNPLAGFQVYETGNELHISPGRYYVDGILVENEADVSILQQPDLPPFPGNSLADILAPPGTALSEGTYLAFLDVWERHVSALEDPDIREVALGDTDTATRTKVVWQVKLMPAEVEEEEHLNCASNLTQWQTLTAASTGRLSVMAEPEATETDPCIVPARAGYRGLENQLYRVEVHRVVSENQITFKWSRENGSVVSAWLAQDTTNPNRLTVKATGRDQVLGFAADDWVELTDDVRELRGLPGILVQIQTIEGNVLILYPGGATIDINDFPLNPKVRRWDMPSEVGEISVNLNIADNWIGLENGVQVKFDSGTFRTGDYWLIPARTARRDIEWPLDDADLPVALLPHGILHHYCRLALVHFDGETWSQSSDCRYLFPPLTEMVRFFHVGGHGQEAMPRQFLPQPLQIGVSNGQWPVEGARVAFNIVQGNGRVQAPGVGTARRIVVETDANGIAECRWRLDARTVSQQVEATLLDIDGKPFVDLEGNPQITPLVFNANLSIASQVAYNPDNCPDLSEAQTVQDAIDILCQRPQGGGCCVTVGKGGVFERLDKAIFTLLEQGERDICICLLAGDHVSISPSIQLALEDRDMHVSIHGCGSTSRLVLEENPWAIHGVRSVTLRDLSIESSFAVNNVEGAISFRHCSQVMITGCHISGLTPEGPLLSIADADQVRLRDNVLEASLFDSLELPQKVFAKAEVEFLAELFSLPTQGDFRQAIFRKGAFESALKLAEANSEDRKKMATQITEVLSDEELRRAMSSGEFFSIFKLTSNLAAEELKPANMSDLLLDIRRAAIKARPGVALVLGEAFPPQEFPPEELGILDEDDLVSLESNEIAGVISLYGLPAPAEFLDEVLTAEFFTALEGQLKEGRIRLNGLLGTLNFRGNQLVQITVTAQVIRAFQDALANELPTLLFGLFGRSLLSDNVFEGGNNLIVNQHLALTANDFKLPAIPFLPSPSAIGVAIADTSIYTGNHGGDPDRVLRDLSRVSTRAANLEITIS